MSGLVRFEWLIGEGLVLALLLAELFNIYRDQWRTRAAERAAKAAIPSPEGAGHAEGQHGLHPGGVEPVQRQALMDGGDGLAQQDAGQG